MNISAAMHFAERFADDIIIQETQTHDNEVQVTDGRIDAGSSSTEIQYTVKLWKKKAHAIVAGTTLSKELIHSAVKIAKANNADEYHYGIPDTQKYKRHSKKISQLSFEQLADHASRIIEQTPKVTLSQAAVEHAVAQSNTLTSNGSEWAESSSLFSAVAAVTAKKNGKVASVWESESEPKPFSLNLGSVVQTKALRALQATKLKIKAPVVLTIHPLSELLTYTFLENLNLKNIEKKRSFLQGKQGTLCFDEKLSIYDDATLRNGVSSYVADFEGSPAQKTTIVHKGELKSYIADYNTAKHNKHLATGNATERGITTSNIILNAPTQELGRAIVVEAILGAHTCDAITGHFSVKVDNAYLFDDGEKKPVKDFLISGKIMDVLNNISSMDTQKQQGGIYSGSIASDKIHVVK